MSSGKAAVTAALAGNSVIAIAKFIAWSLSGSGAMLSEAIHSIADVSNQALLLLGIRRSERGADEKFAYGYGAERYFWALISAVGIFFLGCGVTVVHGLHTLQEGHVPEPSVWDYAILLLSLVIEGWTLGIAIRGLNADRGDKSFLEFLESSMDPTPVAVFLEDTAACLGLVIALIGIFLSQALESAVPDGLASILIGLLLGFVAVLLVRKNHDLLLGRRLEQDKVDELKDYLLTRSSVDRILDFKSRVISAESFKLKMEIDFNGEALARRLLESEDISVLRNRIGGADELFRAWIYEFSERLVDELGDEIDRIEAGLQEKLPGAKHIDIEAD